MTDIVGNIIFWGIGAITAIIAYKYLNQIMDWLMTKISHGQNKGNYHQINTRREHD